jgi:hypothetical protein
MITFYLEFDYLGDVCRMDHFDPISKGIQRINMDTKYRSGDTMHPAGESEKKKG